MHQQSIARAPNSMTPAAIAALRGGRRTLASAVTIVGMICAALVAVYWLQSKPAAVPSATRIPSMQRLSAYLDGRPCDRQRVVALGEQYLQAGQPGALLSKAEQFINTCGPYPRLQWLVYDAHRQLGHWQEAAVVASALINTDPSDKDYWWWRGLAYEKQGEWEQAAHDYRQALVRMPWLDHIPFHLADVLEQLDKPCEAIGPLRQFIAAHPTEQRVVQLRIDRLRRDGGGCRDVAWARSPRRAR